jgi:hypothetical protein
MLAQARAPLPGTRGTPLCTTPQGIEAFIKALQARGIAVYLISGGFRCDLGWRPPPWWPWRSSVC